MTFDMKKARAICAIIDEQRDIFSPDKAAHIEVATEMLPAALDEIERLQNFRDRIARILKQPLSDCDDLLIVGLDSRLCRLNRQAARIAELEGEYEAVTMCFNCGKRAWEIDANEDADLGAIRFDRGSPGSRNDPPEPAYAYFVCNDCLKAEGKIGSSEHFSGSTKRWEKNDDRGSIL